MKSVRKTIWTFLLIFLTDSALRVDAGSKRHDSHLASILAGGLITLLLQEATKVRSGPFSSLRSSLDLSNYQARPRIPYSPHKLSSYGLFSNLDITRNIPEIPYHVSGFGLEKNFPQPGLLNYESRAYMKKIIERQTFLPTRLNNYNPYLVHSQIFPPLALNYNLDYALNYNLDYLSRLCKNNEKINVNGFNENQNNNAIVLGNSHNTFENDLHSDFKEQHSQILPEMITKHVLINGVQNGFEKFSPGLQQNIDGQLQNPLGIELPNYDVQGYSRDVPQNSDFSRNFDKTLYQNYPQNIVAEFPSHDNEGYSKDTTKHFEQELPKNIYIQALPHTFDDNNQENYPKHTNQNLLANDFSQNFHSPETFQQGFNNDVPHYIDQNKLKYAEENPQSNFASSKGITSISEDANSHQSSHTSTDNSSPKSDVSVITLPVKTTDEENNHKSDSSSVDEIIILKI